MIDDSEPTPANIAKIVDASNGLRNGDACFTLHYVPNEGTRRSLSYQDEGFYVAYRLYDAETQLFPRKDVHYVKKSEGQVSEADQIQVRYTNGLEFKTNYLQTVFEVTNKGYFDQRIDLSVFVDSHFGFSSQKIEMRPDGRGFIVYDELNIHYTVFTAEYGGFPAARLNLKPDVKRPASGNIPLENMPFFTKSDMPWNEGPDPMYELY